MRVLGLGIVLLSLTIVLSDASKCRDEDCYCDCCFIPIEGECSKHCFCTSGYFATELKCPKNQVFDPSLAVCVEQDELKCPDFPPSGVDCTGKADGLYKHPKRCDLYVHCSNGFQYIQPCGNGLHFCEDCQRCDYPDIANCQQETECKHDGFYPNEEDCSRYYHCALGKKIELVCKDGLQWCHHCVHPRCEYPDIAKCVPKRQRSDKLHFEFSDSRNRVRVSSPLFRSSANAVDEVFNCTIPNGIYAVPSDAALYLMCHGGRGAFYKCPSGQEFDQESNSCVTSSSYTLLTRRQCGKVSAYIATL